MPPDSGEVLDVSVKDLPKATDDALAAIQDQLGAIQDQLGQLTTLNDPGYSRSLTKFMEYDEIVNLGPWANDEHDVLLNVSPHSSAS